MEEYINQSATATEIVVESTQHHFPTTPSTHEASTNIREAARNFLKNGWRVVPIPIRSKRPVIAKWQNLEITDSQVDGYFSFQQNIGVMLGQASGGLVDVDLDSPEAVTLAKMFLPATAAVFGRESKPASHWLYISPNAEYRKFNDPISIKSDDAMTRKQACIVEIRTSTNDKGKLTVFPPSIHESNERVRWYAKGEPSVVSSEVIAKAVSKLASAALLCQYWQSGIRHELALAVSGVLLRGKFSVEETKQFIEAVSVGAGDDEINDRLKAVDDTYRALNSGERVYGLPKLTDLTDERITKSICEWLDFPKKPISLATSNEKSDSRPFEVVCLRDVKEEKTEWLWKPYIPIGEFTILEGVEGIGKSWIGCALASAVASGRPLPFTNGESFAPANTLMLCAEDSLSHTIKPRLISMEGDLSNVFAIPNVFSFDNVTDCIRFEALVADYCPRLVIIDPLFSYTGGKNLNAESDSRPIARKLIAIAQKFNCAIIGVRHIGKSKGMGDPRNAGLGSVAWRASARSVLLVGQDPDTGERAFCQTKNNLAEHSSQSIGYDILDGQFQWKTSSLTKERMLALPKDAESQMEHGDAIEFLRETLSEGERLSTEVDKEAKQLGITTYALRKAKRALGVNSVKRGGTFGGPIQWFLKIEEGETKTENDEKGSHRHLQPKHSSKPTCRNGLAEDVDSSADRDLQTPSNEKLPSANRPTGRQPAVCECGERGYANQSCRDCGEIITPF